MRMLDLLIYLNPDWAHVGWIAGYVYRDKKDDLKGWSDGHINSKMTQIITNTVAKGWEIEHYVYITQVIEDARTCERKEFVVDGYRLAEEQWQLIQAAFGPHGKLGKWNRMMTLTPENVRRELDRKEFI